MEMADRLAQDGWRDLGYTYLNIDDCWIGGRDANGSLVADPKRFPNGIAFLADYVSSAPRPAPRPGGQMTLPTPAPHGGLPFYSPCPRTQSDGEIQRHS